MAVLGGCAVTTYGPRDPGGPDGPVPLVPAVRDQGDKFSEGLERTLRAADAGAWFDVLVDLTEQVDLRALGAELDREPLARAERRVRVVEALETVAARQQARLASTLETMAREGEIGLVRPVAIVNRLVIEGTAAGILRLAASPEIARVTPEWTSAGRTRSGRGSRSAGPGRNGLGDTFTSWALDAIGAPALWEQGFDGNGIVVASIDTGVFADHEQLRDGMLDDGRGWFDPVDGRTEPYDSHGHGTSVLAVAVGRNVAGRTIGVAPGARWATALGNFRNVYSRTRMTLAADWVLREARPDVLINAWSDDSDPCSRFDIPFIDAWKAAEIFVVFPAGNSGPGSATGEAPAQLSGTYPDGGPVFSVAGLDPDGGVHAESSRGPSRCGSHPFPTLAAPGGEIPFAFPGGPDHYGVGAGTSLAAGLVAGAAALILQAEPGLDVAGLERALIAGARDLAPEGHDPASGAGRLDLEAALEAGRRIAREHDR